MSFLVRERSAVYASVDDESEASLYPALTAESQVGDSVSIEYKGVQVNARVTKRTEGWRNNGKYRAVEFELRIIGGRYDRKLAKKTLSLDEGE